MPEHRDDAWALKAEQDYKEFLDAAAADENVVGVVLSGSRGAGHFVTDRSDFDVFVVTKRPTDRYPFIYASSVEAVAMTLDAFESYTLPGFSETWNRPAFRYARVDLDKPGGEIERIVDRKRRLTTDEATSLAGKALDDYINALYRSLRNLEAGRDIEGRLDAADTIPPFLTTAFALEGRVRPFNKWLRFELAREPLAIEDVADRVDLIRCQGDPQEQRALFRDLERVARQKGHGPGVDNWEPYLAWLRGDTGR